MDDFGNKMFSSHFTPLESPAACPVRSSASIGACSGDEDKIPFGANTGFKAPCEPSRWKVEDLLTGFTFHFKRQLFLDRISNYIVTWNKRAICLPIAGRKKRFYIFMLCFSRNTE